MKRENTALQNLRHSFAHLLAAAVTTMYPDAKPTIGPSTDDGFYYDFDFGDVKISEPDLKDIEKKMESIVQKWKSFDRQEVTPDQARQIFANNPYKIELINELEENNKKAVIAGEETSPLQQHDGPKSSTGKDSKTADHIYTPITLYTSGSFTDLCRGGHINDASKVMRHFKLMSIAGAYWRGSEKNKMLTRIYGTAFATKQELENYLKMLEEAKKRDHKKLGVELDLFTFSDLVGGGLPLWTPKGTVVREELDSFVWKLRKEKGYQKVVIPHITKKDLYETSGHWAKFQTELFRITTREGHEFAMKPMNCPHHTQIYAHIPRSYKDLPQRYAETTMVYRDEQSGELSGLSRVRCITQDDAHVFCRKSQITQEGDAIWDIIENFYSAFGFDLEVRLSYHDPDNMSAYLGTQEAWQIAEKSLKELVEKRGVKNYKEAVGEAAFYGPKIDFMANDSLGRKWQVATIQLDVNMPDRFNLFCTNEKGEEERIVMFHCAIMGSIERFMSVLIEHYAGAFPLWLAPVQICLLPIADRHFEYARKVANELASKGIRAEVDESSRTIGAKIRYQTLQKVPYMGIIGDKEIESSSVSIRSRIGLDHSVMNIDALTQKFVTEIENHT